MLVDFLVFAHDAQGRRGIHADEGVQHVVQHAGGLFPHQADRHGLRGADAHAALENLAHRLGDLLRFVADALEVGDGLADGHQHPQIDRRRLAPGDDMGERVVDGDFHFVYPRVAFHDGFGQLPIHFVECTHRVTHLFFDQPAHARQARADVVELGIELLHQVFAHGFLLVSRNGR